MSGRKRRLRWVTALLLTLTSAAAGVYVAATLGPDRLRHEIERQVESATGWPCRVETLYLVPGLPVELVAGGLSLWDGALLLEGARARVSVAAALVGEVRLSRLELDGVSLVIGAEGAASPWPWERGPAAPDHPAAPRAGDLAQRLQDAVGALIGVPLLADTVRVRGGRVDVRLPGDDAPVTFALEDLHGELTESRLRGDRTLVMQARIRAADRHRGLLEGQASRSHGGALHATLTATDLDLAWLGRRLRPGRSGPRGTLSGVVDLAAATEGPAVLDLDLVARNLSWHEARETRPILAVSRVALGARAEIDARRISIAGARLRSGPLDVHLDADLARPLSSRSELGLRLRLADLAVEDLRDLLTGMRASWLEDTRSVLESLEGGRIVELTARARGALRDWREGDSEPVPGLPRGLALGARLEDLRIRLGEHDAIERIAIDASWRGDRLVLRDVHGERGGRALPRLDLELDGVSHLLASNLTRRVPDSDEVHLVGLPLLLSLFERDPEPETPFEAPHVEVRLQRLEHPALLWPMQSVEMGVDGRAGTLVAELRRATWADVPLRGTLEWRDDPMHLVARLEAGATPVATPSPFDVPAPFADPGSPAPSALPGKVWGVGAFAIGPLRSAVWSHERVAGRFRAAVSSIAFDDVGASLAPKGRLSGNGVLDLSRPDALPYHATFVAGDLDADALFRQAGLGDDRVSGRVALSGELRGRYEPERNPFAALSGHVDVDAAAGRVRHDLPAVLALTLAGEGLNFFRESDYVRFSRCAARLALDEGVARTEALSFDGPDVRMYGAGSLDLGHPPYALDAEVVVFLFRPVDRVLGAVPILGSLILGGSDNLFAAYFRLEGPWDAPTATSEPLRSLNTGPLRIVTGLPGIVRRGLTTLGEAFPAARGDSRESPPAQRAQP